MGRKNRRDSERTEPLDLSEIRNRRYDPSLPSIGERHWYRERERADREQREAARLRQKNARINGGIDWSACLVPNCGEELWYGTYRPAFADPEMRDHTAALPLCSYHLTVASVQHEAVEPNIFGPNLVAHIEARVNAVAEAICERERAMPREVSSDGYIYALRQNGLIKVGWTSNTQSRLRAYGPDVDVLLIYPGTRQDETDLHRSFTPARARGREWYEDGPILGDWIAKMLDRWGTPNVPDTWTRPTKIVGSKRFTA